MIEAIVNYLRPVRFRGKVRLFHPLVAKQGTRRANVFGYQMDLDLEEFIQRMIYLGTYERKETSQVLGYLRPRMTFVDVGANVGYFSLAAASKVGREGRVFSFEPSPLAANKFQATLEQNQLDFVTLCRCGLGSQAETVPLAVPSTTNHTPSMLVDTDQNTVSVRVQTLDACLAEWDVDQVDLLKMDVERYEPQVLAGATASLEASKIKALLCEFNDVWLRRAGTDAPTLYKQVLDWGFVDTEGTPKFVPQKTLNRFFLHRTYSHK